jgi:hypothetical protein
MPRDSCRYRIHFQQHQEPDSPPPIISLGMAWMIPTARIEGAFPLSYLVRGSEVIPTAAVERPLSEVGVPGAKESPH